LFTAATGMRAAALALALAAWLVTHETFQPIAHRFTLQGAADSVSVHLPDAQPLHLEFELSVHAESAAESGVDVRMNGTSIARVAPPTRYAFQRVRVAIPGGAVTAGNNRLEFEAYGDPDARFEIRGRLHNFYGISPRFPRAVVVSDEAAWLWWSRLGAFALVRFAGFALASFVVLLLFVRMLALLDIRPRLPVLFAPSFPLVSLAAYSLATPLHVWLSVEALLVLTALPVVLVCAGAWVRAHRALVVRFAVAAAMTLIGTEILFRAYNRMNPSFIFYSDSYDRFRPPPGARHFDTVLNSRGFNDVEYPATKPTGVRRIVALGDSFTWGVVPYAANFLTLLETELARDQQTEVINMGIPGAEPKDYLSLLVAEGLAFEPDIVLVGFYIGNDFEAPERKAYEYSYVATFIRFLWQLRSVEAPPSAWPDTFTDYDDGRPAFARERFLEIEADRAQIFMVGNTEFGDAVSRVAGDLREMQAVCSRSGADLYVVLMPAEVQVDTTLQEEVMRAHRSGRDAFDFAQPNRLLAAALSNAGIAFVDLLPVFMEHSRTTRLYKPQDTHWNIAGNRVAADALTAFVRRISGRS
jgi:hypothetical protein